MPSERADRDANCELPAVRATPEQLRKVLADAKTIAVVGLSRNPDKASHAIAAYLQRNGYRVLPVNPQVEGQLLGERVYLNLREIDVPVDVVDVFRPSEDVPAIVDDAIAIKAKAVWLQEGIVHNAAAEKAKAAGLAVVMDRCMQKEHRAMSAGGLGGGPARGA